jgi:ubiquinone/menaquinone biosynthesis C-methylase UbiE
MDNKLELIKYGNRYHELSDNLIQELFNIKLSSSLTLKLLREYVKIFGYPDFLATRRFDIVKNKVQFKRGERVLDIGCGKAIYATMLDKYDVHYIGIEPEVSRCALAQKLVKELKINAEIVNWMAEDIKLPNNSVDYIIAIEVIEHIEDDKIALRKMARVLKKGGYLILSTPNHDDCNVWEESHIEHNSNFGHKRPGYSHNELLDMLSDINVNVIHYERLFSIKYMQLMKFIHSFSNKLQFVPLVHPFAYFLSVMDNSLNRQPKRYFNHLIIGEKL